MPPVEFETEHYRSIAVPQQPLPGEPALHWTGDDATTCRPSGFAGNHALLVLQTLAHNLGRWAGRLGERADTADHQGPAPSRFRRTHPADHPRAHAESGRICSSWTPCSLKVLTGRRCSGRPPARHRLLSFLLTRGQERFRACLRRRQTSIGLRTPPRRAGKDADEPRRPVGRAVARPRGGARGRPRGIVVWATVYLTALWFTHCSAVLLLWDLVGEAVGRRAAPAA